MIYSVVTFKISQWIWIKLKYKFLLDGDFLGVSREGQPIVTFIGHIRYRPLIGPCTACNKVNIFILA